MNNQRTQASRAAFTAIELLMVIGIMMTLMGIAVPTVLPSIRHGNINSAVNDISMCWRQARILAMTTAIPAGASPYHFGIAIRQSAGQQASVALIFDNVATGTPKYFMAGEDPSDQSTYSASGTAAAFFKFNRNVIVASTPAGGSNTDAPTTADQTIIIYAQYGTGLPLSPDNVAMGRGQVSPPCSMGVASDAALTATVCPRIQLWTQDYSVGPSRHGYASSFAIYHAGFTVSQEL